MKLRFKLGYNSFNVEKTFGVRFEVRCLGGMGVHYGHPYKTWLLVLYVGHYGYAAGVARMDQPIMEISE